MLIEPGNKLAGCSTIQVSPVSEKLVLEIDRCLHPPEFPRTILAEYADWINRNPISSVTVQKWSKTRNPSAVILLLYGNQGERGKQMAMQIILKEWDKKQVEISVDPSEYEDRDWGRYARR
jgi:hypothetical protein